MSKQSRLIGTTLILLVGIIGTKLINFIMLPFLTTWMTVEEYGNVDVFLTIISLVVPIATLQLEQAVFRFLIDDKTLEQKQHTVSSAVLPLAAILLAGSVAAGAWFGLRGEYDRLLYVAAIDLNAVYVMTQQIVRGEGKNKAYTVSSILYAFLLMALAALLIRGFGLGYYGYVLAYLLASLTCIVYLAVSARCGGMIRLGALRKDTLERMVKYSVPMILNNVSWWVLNASDKLVINVFLGTAANGVFAAAGKIPGLITSVYSVFQMAWMESASREQEEEGLEEFYSGVFRSLLAVISYGVIVILLLRELVFPVLINVRANPAYVEAFDHIPILLLGLFFLCMAQFYGGIYVGMHRSSELGWTSAVAAAVNLAVDLILVHFVGLYAASISTLTAYFVIFVIRGVITKRAVRITYYPRQILLTAGCMAAAMAGCYLLEIFWQLLMLGVISVIYVWVYRDVLQDMLRMVRSKMRKTN